MNRILRLSLLALLPVATLAAQDKVSLRIGAKKGDKQLFQQVSSQTQSIDIAGQQMETGSKVTQVFEIEITGTGDGGTVEATMRIVRTKGNITMPMATEEITFDSASPDDDSDGMGISSALTAFAGKVFPIKVAANGEVTAIQGTDEALAEARKKTNGMGAQMLGGQLNETSLKRLAQSAFGQLPAQAIATGDSYERSSKNRSRNMDLQVNSKYTLSKVDDKQVELELTGTIATPGDKAAGKADGKAEGKEEAKGEAGDEQQEAIKNMLKGMKIEKSKITGKDTIDRVTGLVVKSAQKVEMSMTMPSPMGGGEMAIDSVNEITTERTTAAAAAPAKKDKEAAKPAEPAKAEGGKR